MFRYLSLFFLSLSAAYSQPKTVGELQKAVVALAPDLVEATVAIFMGSSGSGSGVIVTPDGLIISAAHVTMTPGTEVKVLLSDGRELSALTLGVDHSTDGSLLKITAPGPFPHRPYIKEKNYEVGDWVIATGHPGGPIIERPAPVRLGQITQAGIESGFRNPLASTTTIISGDSGGPLFNLEGEVIGINSNIGMPWLANQHVPLPAMINKWEELMSSKTIGGEDNILQGGFLFDDPYKELRERFLSALKKHQDHALAKRPQKLSPHEMQGMLDRWQPDADAPQQVQLGIQIDLSQVEFTVIQKIIPGSPASMAELEVGDRITAVNDVAVTSPTQFALSLVGLDPTKKIVLEKNGEESLTLQPNSIPARKHFPMPLAGLVAMAVNKDAVSVMSSAFLNARQDMLKTAPPVDESVVELRRGDELIAHATVTAKNELLTKASLLGDIQTLECCYKEKRYPVLLLASDETHDLALLQTSATGLKPVQWRIIEPRLGSLIFSAADEAVTMGCVTQPMRSSPKAGYEHNQSQSDPTVWLGVSFSPSAFQLEVANVEVGGPADRAGFLEGDLIIKFGSLAVASQQELEEALALRAAGEKVTLVVQRDDAEVTLKPILGIQPGPEKGVFLRRSAMRDDNLRALSARGGELSKRRLNFPEVLYHDLIITPQQAGTPIYDVKGRAIGMNIARSYRHRTLAIPAKVIDQVLWKIRP